ncbi:MAG: hypothetical protein HKL99_05095 [Burkholderiales bacterium]|nr:hypothetical protein [Burkholderiales bacterium]
MRAGFGLIGLLLALLIVAWLAKTELAPPPVGSQAGGAKASVSLDPSINTPAQGAAALDQFKQKLNQALQTRPVNAPSSP